VKYKFYITDDGKPAEKIPPMSVVIQIVDNLKDDNTEELRKTFQEFYADGFNVKVVTAEEFNKNRGDKHGKF
jgi:hypothetical protein